MLLLVQYAGSLVICKGWRRPNTVDVERWPGDLSGCHCAKSCRTMRFCSFMSHQQGTLTKQVQICTYMHVGAFSNWPVLRSNIISQIYTNAYTNIIYATIIMYIHLNLYVSKKNFIFPCISHRVACQLRTISSMGIPGSLAQLNN